MCAGNVRFCGHLTFVCPKSGVIPWARGSGMSGFHVLDIQRVGTPGHFTSRLCGRWSQETCLVRPE